MLGSQPSNIALPVEQVERRIDAADEFPRIVRAASDLAMASRWQNEDKSAPQLNRRRFFRKIAFVHANPSPLNTPEQLGNGPRLCAESNKHFGNLICFRRTAINQRPTVSGLPDAANDNDLPREVEAA